MSYCCCHMKQLLSPLQGDPDFPTCSTVSKPAKSTLLCTYIEPDLTNFSWISYLIKPIQIEGVNLRLKKDKFEDVSHPCSTCRSASRFLVFSLGKYWWVLQISHELEKLRNKTCQKQWLKRKECISEPAADVWDWQSFQFCHHLYTDI